MKLPDVVAVSARFVWADGFPAPPDDPAPVHAVRVNSLTPSWIMGKRAGTGPFIIEPPANALETACGSHGRVVWPGWFDNTDPDCCPRCLADLLLEQADPEEWKRSHRARRERRYARQQEAKAVKEHNRAEWDKAVDEFLDQEYRAHQSGDDTPA